MTKIAASTSVVQPTCLPSQSARAAKRTCGQRRLILLQKSILRRSLVSSLLTENPVNGGPADLERLGDVVGPHALSL
jgi:hypothetical protein